MRAALDRAQAGASPRLGVAVSGGSDSTALLYLAHGWAQARGVELAAITVDHGLRPEAAAEAAAVGARCAALGVPHAVRRWRDWDGRGNLQDAARRARRRLIGEWAAEQGIGAVALGHTRDDQAETVLLRLARGSGVDGLSAMAEASGTSPRWLRPLLTLERAGLREWLAARGHHWCEDPSNADEGFARIRARQALGGLAPLGVTAQGLAATADRLALARDALSQLAAMAAHDCVRLDRGDVVFDRARLAAWPEETRLRLAAHAIRWITGSDYRPRLSALRAALAADVPRTLACVLTLPNANDVRLTRELAAVAGVRAAPGDVWDGRWRLDGPARPGDAVIPLGAALRDCPEWRAAGLPRASLAASPAVWRGGALVAAPLAGFGAGWTATLVRGEEVFYTSLLSR